MKNVFRVVLFIVGFILVDRYVSPFVFAPCSIDEYAMADEEKNNYDTICIGASKVLFGFEPSTIETHWEQCGEVYNAGTESQRLNTTYYYLKDLLKRNDVETVILGMTYRAYHADHSLYDANINGKVLDRIKDSDIRMEMMKQCFSGLDYFGLICNTYRYGPTAMYNGWEWVFKQIGYKLEAIDEDYIEIINDRTYVESGFAIRRHEYMVNGNHDISNTEPWDIDNISDAGMMYLDKIVSLCKDNNVELIMVVPPSTNGYIYAVDEQQGSYDEINNFFKEYADENNVDYYNFNLAKFKVNELNDDCFADERHLAPKGATLFSKEFAEIMNKRDNGEDISFYFFESFEEMRQAIKHVVCVDLDLVEEDGETLLLAQTLQDDELIVEYQFCGKNREDDEWTVIVPWSSENKVGIKSKYDNYRVNVRNVESIEEYEAFWEIKGEK